MIIENSKYLEQQHVGWTTSNPTYNQLRHTNLRGFFIGKIVRLSRSLMLVNYFIQSLIPHYILPPTKRKDLICINLFLKEKKYYHTTIYSPFYMFIYFLLCTSLYSNFILNSHCQDWNCWSSNNTMIRSC